MVSKIKGEYYAKRTVCEYFTEIFHICKRKERFGMETTNKKRVIMLAVLGIAIVCICIIGVFAKKAYDRHQ